MIARFACRRGCLGMLGRDAWNMNERLYCAFIKYQHLLSDPIRSSISKKFSSDPAPVVPDTAQSLGYPLRGGGISAPSELTG